MGWEKGRMGRRVIAMVPPNPNLKAETLNPSNLRLSRSLVTNTKASSRIWSSQTRQTDRLSSHSKGG
jgi:hypothetical protein